MKKIFMTVCVMLSAMLMSTGVLAAEEKTEAFMKLADSIIGEVEDENSDEYVVYDEYGIFWKADFAEDGSIVSMYTVVEDEDAAEEIAEYLGEVVEYSLPFTAEYDEPLVKEILVPVYKNSQVNVICARPTNLYASGEKNIQNILLGENDVLVFDTRANSSFKAVVSYGNLTAQHLWGDSWIPEEELNGKVNLKSIAFNFDVNKVKYKEGKEPVEPKFIQPQPEEPKFDEPKPEEPKLDEQKPEEKLTEPKEEKFKFELPQDKKEIPDFDGEIITKEAVEASTEVTTENSEVSTKAFDEFKNKPFVEMTTGTPLETTTEEAVETTTESDVTTATEATTEATTQSTTEKATKVQLTTQKNTEQTTKTQSTTQNNKIQKRVNSVISTETTTVNKTNKTDNNTKNNQNNTKITVNNKQKTANVKTR